MATEDLKELAEGLRIHGLTEFLTANNTHLYNKTMNPDIFGDELLNKKIIFNQSQLDECLHLPGTYKQNRELYKRIQVSDNCYGYLQALKGSGNEGVIGFIRKTLAQVPVSHSQPDSPASASKAPPVSTSTSSVPVPTTPKGLHVSGRLQAYLQRLRVSGIDYPFDDFTRPHLVEMYDDTQNYEKLIIRLKSYGVLDDYAAKKIRATPEWNTLELGQALYERININWESCIPALIKALEKSGNETMINNFDQWLNNKENPSPPPESTHLDLINFGPLYPLHHNFENTLPTSRNSNAAEFGNTPVPPLPSTSGPQLANSNGNAEELQFSQREPLTSHSSSQRVSRLSVLPPEVDVSDASGATRGRTSTNAQEPNGKNEQMAAARPDDDEDNQMPLSIVKYPRLKFKDFVDINSLPPTSSILLENKEIVPPTPFDILKNLIRPSIDLPHLQTLKISIPTIRHYKKILKSLLFFTHGKSKLNHLWTLPSIQTVDLAIGNETILKFDKTTKNLLINRFSFINPDNYLQDSYSRNDGLLKFACFRNTLSSESLKNHSPYLTTLILNNCILNPPGDMTSFLSSFPHLQTLIIDSGRQDITINIEALLTTANQLNLLTIGHSTVTFPTGINTLKGKLRGKDITFFNCRIMNIDSVLTVREDVQVKITLDDRGEILPNYTPTQWNTRKHIYTPGYIPKDDFHYFNLFQMNLFSSYEDRYFKF